MNEDEAYLDIAQRFLQSCEQHIQNAINIQEVIGFESYHVFESIAGAFNSHYGHNVPKGHPQKLNAFVANSRHNQHVDSIAVATIAMTLNRMRDKYLYPEKNGTVYKRPQEQISLTDAKTLVRRIRGIVRQIERLI